MTCNNCSTCRCSNNRHELITKTEWAISHSGQNVIYWCSCGKWGPFSSPLYGGTRIEVLNSFDHHKQQQGRSGDLR